MTGYLLTKPFEANNPMPEAFNCNSKWLDGARERSARFARGGVRALAFGAASFFSRHVARHRGTKA